MNKMIITGFAVATAFAAAAMPTKTELAQAQKPVEDATKADLAALKAGQKTAKEVAESHLALAAKAENQAEKYLYYQGAFKLYARSGEYSCAIDTLETLKRDVKDVTPEVIDELVGQELRGVAKEQGKQISRRQEDKTVCAGPSRTGCRLARKCQDGKGKPNFSECTETIGGYTWSYRVENGRATIIAEDKKVGGYSCAVSPKPTERIAIPSTLGGVKVTGIGERAFVECRGLKSVTIPEGVTTIGSCAFLGCREIESMTFPASVRSIEGSAFCWCIGLKSVTIPEGVTDIGSHAFQRCPLATLTIPSSVANLAAEAVWMCGELTSVTMLGEKPNAPKGGVFKDCGKLKEIHVPANAKSWAGMKEWQGIPLVFDAK